MTILAKLTLPDESQVELARAGHADIPAIVALLVDDPIGLGREVAADLVPYETAFAAIDGDPAHLLVVARDGQRVVGTLQLSFIPGMARGGALRGQIEAVRVHEAYRSRGLGAKIFAWAVEESRTRDCALVQLTTDRSRVDARMFYERLGFVATHEGFKLML